MLLKMTSCSASLFCLMRPAALCCTGIADTSAGYLDAEGNVVGVGQYWRHNRVCYGTNCATEFLVYK